MSAHFPDFEGACDFQICTALPPAVNNDSSLINMPRIQFPNGHFAIESVPDPLRGGGHCHYR